MQARRPARLRRRDAFYRAVQRLRLDRIAAGSLQPRFEREHYFLWTFKARGQANYADFIIPGLLFMAEYEADRAGAGKAAPPPPALTDRSRQEEEEDEGEDEEEGDDEEALTAS